jgi:hypothetical protein
MRDVALAPVATEQVTLLLQGFVLFMLILLSGYCS